MISLENAKLGKIPSWNLPPRESCPGSTKLCRETCYVGGKSGYLNIYKSAGLAYERNLDATLDGSWKVEILRFLSKRQPEAFRVHVSGDFFSSSYIDAWSEIVAMFPATKFYAYTRSWRVPRLRAALSRLQAMPNMVLFASCDSESGPAPSRWIRKAWMGQPEETTEKPLMCPGYGPRKLSCETCKICVKGSAKNIWFPIH